MDETALNELVDAWIAAESSASIPESQWWAVSQVMDWALEGEGEQLWRFITAVHQRDVSDKVIGALAAGPLEDLLAKQGPQFIERVEELARKDPKFNYVLGGVWRNSMTEDTWRRVQAARLKVW